MKVEPEPVMSEVVRQRLESLLAEVQPRHALPEPAPPPPSTARTPPGGGPPARAPVQRPAGEPVGVEPASEAAPRRRRPLRALMPAGGLAVRSARQAIQFVGEHLAAVLVVLLVGCGWTAYSLLQARSTQVAFAAPPSVVASPSVVVTPAAGASPSLTASAAPTVLVHVLGAVRRPGVVELAEGSRVQDAIAAAGGLTSAADPAELNLASVVADGSQVVIGTHRKPRGEVRGDGGQSASGQGSASTSPISLNTASLEQLDTLPGVGPVTAQKILAWREKHGRFSSVSELQEVDGIGPKTYADLAPNVRV